MKKNLLFLMLLFFPFAAAASLVKCPAVNAIHNGQLEGWLPLYIDNEELASKQDINKFQAYVTYFKIARWASSYLENGHCFYQGADPIFDKIVLAKDSWQPEKNTHWYWVVPSTLAECNAREVEHCKFIE